MTNPLHSMSRMYFLWVMVVLVLIQILGSLFISVVEVPRSLVQSINVSITVCIALAAGSRLVDAGYRRWVGVGGVFVIVCVLPAVISIAGVFLFGLRASDLIDFAPVLVIVMVALLTAFLVWAGTKRSVIAPRSVGLDDQFVGDREDYQRVQRREPRF